MSLSLRKLSRSFTVRSVLVLAAVATPFACSDPETSMSRNDDGEQTGTGGGASDGGTLATGGNSASGGSSASGGKANAGTGGDDALGGAGGMGGQGVMLPPGTLSVTLLDRGTPIEGSPVMLGSSDGKFLRTKDTNAQGKADFVDVPAGAMVTAVLRADTRIELQTIGNLLGDVELTFGDSTPAVFTSLGKLDVRVEDSVPLGTRYEHPSLGGGSYSAPAAGLPWTIPTYNNVTSNVEDDAGEINVMALALVNWEPVAFAFEKNVQFTGLPAAANVTLNSWTSAHGTIALKSDLPSPIQASSGIQLFRAGSEYFGRYDGFSPAATDLNASIIATDSFFDEVQLRVTHSDSQAGMTFEASRRQRELKIPADDTTDTYDFKNADFFPLLSGMSASSIDWSQRMLSTGLSSAPSCLGAEASAANLIVTGTVDTAPARWKLLLPYDNDFVLPELDPAESEALWGTSLVGTGYDLTLVAPINEDATAFFYPDPAWIVAQWYGKRSASVVLCTTRASSIVED